MYMISPVPFTISGEYLTVPSIYVCAFEVLETKGVATSAFITPFSDVKKTYVALLE